MPVAGSTFHNEPAIDTLTRDPSGVQAGYQGIRIEMDIRAKNASDAELDDLLQFAQAHSPVCNTVCRPVPVVVERVKR